MVTSFLSRFLVRLIVLLVVSGLGVSGLWQLWTGAAPPKAEVASTAGSSRAGHVMLAFDQAMRSVNDYVRTGDRRDREEFGDHTRRLGEMITALEMASDAKERRIGGALRGYAVNAESLASGVLALPDPSIGVSGAVVVKLQGLSDVREQAMLTAGELRELDEGRASKNPSDSLDGLLKGGFVALGVSLAGAVGLARFTVV